MMLNKYGYTLLINAWIGRLGNHLMQLSSAIHVAKKTKSILHIPKHDVFKRNTYDFRKHGVNNCNETISSRFFFRADCFQFSLDHDCDRRKIFQEYIYDILIKKAVIDRIKNYFNVGKVTFGDDTLVINIRSGKDIFQSSPLPQNDYMQPPSSFYKYIIEKYDYKEYLIVTEADRANTVIVDLLSWNNQMKIKNHISVNDDIHTILNATHLVAAHSSFTWCLALMSKKLKMLHQPESCQIRGVKDFKINTYGFLDYIQAGHWIASADQLDLMVKHSTKDVFLTDNNAVDNEISSTI